MDVRDVFLRQDDYDRTNAEVEAEVDIVAVAVDVAVVADVSRVPGLRAGRTKPPPAGAYSVDGVSTALLRSLRHSVLCRRAQP